jgi:murein L,D-transpeptidase YcbB/YkuD
LRSGKTHYARVNLPAYQLELYRDGKRYRSHRTIIGKNKLDYNRRKWEQGFLNRTPMFSSRIYKIQVNPVWIIPPRVRDEFSKDSAVLQRKGIRQVRDRRSGRDLMVQSAGKHNALGRVKFVLSNTANVYLHDTNMPWLFNNTERDYSHGCVRVEHAVDLARDLAAELAGVSTRNFNTMLEHGRPRTITLKEPLPVFVDYNTVQFDESGQLNFLPDIYTYDYAFFAGKLPVRGKTWFGSSRLKPRRVPRIQYSDFLRIKKAGVAAPLVWPPEESAPQG